MNNIAIGGNDPRTGNLFSFYETIGGGTGACKGHDGINGIHSHMTNTLNTPIEALETEYPLRVLRYSFRSESGGKGQWKGGDGIVREIEILSDDCYVSIQSERRSMRPWGLNGGEPGESGRNILRYEMQEYELQAKSTVKVLRNSVVVIGTPGGGGWGEWEGPFE